MEFNKWRVFFGASIILMVLLAGVSFSLNIFTKQNAQVIDRQNNVLASQKKLLPPPPPPPPPPPEKLANPPEIIKAIYVTGYSAGAKSYLNYLENLFKTTEINAVVIDIKGSDGRISYPVYAILDIDNLVRFLHNQNIYVIGRIAVFEDPMYAKVRPDLAIFDKIKNVLWKDNNGLVWMDPASKDVWDYNISLAREAFDKHGFDEINFDYARFPTDGKMENMGFPIYDGKTAKADIIKGFFEYIRSQLAGKISVDIFGQTTTSKDDMGIGQIIENAFLNFDYVCPMVYPSHYAGGFVGFEKPAEHPYEVVKYSLDSGLARLKLQTNSKAKIRPWLQDFNMGAYYTADMVKAEIKATQDALKENYVGFMLWNPSNVYTQGAIKKN